MSKPPVTIIPWVFFLCLFLFFSHPTYAKEKGPVGTVRVGIFPFEPFNFIDTNGVAQGLNPDLLKEMIRDEQWNVEFVKGSWAECLDRLQRQEIDLMVSVAYSPERSQLMDFTYESVAELWGQVFVRPEGKAININDLEDSKVAVMRRDISGLNFMKTAKTLNVNCQIIELASHADVLAAVQRGEADAGIAPQHFGLRHAKDYNLVGSTIIFSPFSIYFASKKGTQHVLLSHIDAHLAAWKRDKNSIYYKKLEQWLGGVNLDRKVPAWVTYLLFLAMFSALLFFGFSLLLKKKVRQRTHELQESEFRYRELVENANSIIMRIDSNGVISYFNEFAQRFFGYEADEIIGRNAIGTIIPARDASGKDQRDMLSDLMQAPNFMTYEKQGLLRDGTRVWIAWTSKPICNDSGEIDQILCVGSDMTDRKLAEKQLVESHELLDNLAKMVPGFIYQYRLLPDGRAAFPYASPGIVDIYEVEPQDVREDASPIWNRFHPDDLPRINEAMLESARTLDTFLCDFRVILPKQGIRWRWSQAQPQRMEDGSTIWHGITSDITKHKLAEEALRASEEDLKESQRIAHVGTWRLDTKSNQVVWSEELYRMYGFDPRLPPPPYTEHSRLFTPESWQRLSTALENTRTTGIPYDLELKTERADGTQGWMWVHGVTIKNEQGETVGLRGVAQDISERKLAEEEKKELAVKLQQAQKMEAIGTLAGGIAHDFNNILSVILGFAELARNESAEKSSVADDLEQVILAGNRAKELVKQILAFSRQAQSNLVPLNPATIIKETLKLLRASLPSTITIRQDIDVDAGLILADPTHIHQIMMNLCTNAFHAMEAQGGTLTVKLKQAEIDSSLRDLPPGENKYIVLSIIDTGVGIEMETLEKIFDPYFTTKDVGKGTGMGLAVVQGIVESYGGFITCDSRPGEGSAFHITLPTTRLDKEEERDAAETLRHNRERILLIDDEEALLEMNAKLLDGLGFRVTAKNNSIEALSTFLDQPHGFDLIITDQTMPGMTGVDIAQRILRVRPEMPIILCTGYSSQVSEEKAKTLGIQGFAYKPMTRSDLSNLIAEVLAKKFLSVQRTKN